MPRRLIAISSSTMMLAKTASWPLSWCTAAAAYCAPDEIDTATVRT